MFILKIHRMFDDNTDYEISQIESLHLYIFIKVVSLYFLLNINHHTYFN